MAFTEPQSINGSLGLPEFLDYANEVTYSWFSNFTLIAIWVILLVVYGNSQNDWAGAFAVAGFGTFIVGLLFFLGQLISGFTFAVVIAFAVLGALILFVDRR